MEFINVIFNTYKLLLCSESLKHHQDVYLLKNSYTNLLNFSAIAPIADFTYSYLKEIK